MSIDPPTYLQSEYSRIKRLSEFDLDYFSLQDEFNGLVKLAALIAGTEFSLVNLIDNYTQWTVAASNLDINQMPREDSVCNFTIQSPEPLEILRLDKDERFLHKDYVSGPDGIKYYIGFPLTLNSGENLGALCLIDKRGKILSEEVISQLKIIASEIVDRLEMKRRISNLENEIDEANKTKNQLAHDIRSPLAGITGLCDSLENEEILPEDFNPYLKIINKSGKRVLELTREILEKDQENSNLQNTYDLREFHDKLKELYQLAAKAKNIDLEITYADVGDRVRFPKKILLSAVGNLISNSVKFTLPGGSVKVHLSVSEFENSKKIIIEVIDNGAGIPASIIERIGQGDGKISFGTSGEKGFGMGLQLVNEMVKSRNGSMQFEILSKGSKIILTIPFAQGYINS